MQIQTNEEFCSQLGTYFNSHITFRNIRYYSNIQTVLSTGGKAKTMQENPGWIRYSLDFSFLSSFGF
jgi:hypothetical protein